MEKKTWYKPTQGSGILKSGDLKSMLKKREDPLLIACLYLDTTDMTLIKNGMVFMIADMDGTINQMAVLAEEGSEYLTHLPDSGVDLSLFPKPVSEKLCAALNGAPLQIQFISAFEQKQRTLMVNDNPAGVLVRLLAHYEDGAKQHELCALSAQGMQSDHAGPTAEQLAAVGVLTPCEPPYVEAMRLCAAGCRPLLCEKRFRKTVKSNTAYMLGTRSFELVSAYVALGKNGFDKNSLLRLRVAARKLMALVQVFEETFRGSSQLITVFLAGLVDDTDSIRAIDLLADEMDTLASIHRDFDFSPLKNRLDEKRDACCEQLKKIYDSSTWADGMAAIWVKTHKNMHDGFIDEDIIKATDRIRAWIVELNMYKKTDLKMAVQIHEYRKTVRKLRYALEGLSDVTTKRLAKGIKVCKKLQDEFGMAGDMACHINTLQTLSAEENSTDIALLCGVCCGIFAEGLADTRDEAIAAWKDCRNELKTLEDTI